MSGTLVLGIGNQLAGDDSAGIYLVELLNSRSQKIALPLSPALTAITAETAPESFASVVRRHQPDLLILVDAADMGLTPGTLRVIGPGRIDAPSLSTHDLPLSMFMSYVRELCGSVVLVGVQPQYTEMGRPLSPPVRKSMKALAAIILEGRIAEIPPLEEKT
jgi:hydrogenase 3 maturation protease